MRPAASRLVVGLALGWLAACGVLADPAPQRSAPTRPGGLVPAPALAPAPASRSASTNTPSARRRGRADLVSVVEMAATLGLKGAWTEPGHRFTLSDGARRIELEANSREVSVNRMRVFLGEPTVMRGGRLCVSRTDFEACLEPILQPALLEALPPRPRVIALDPGHGGIDNGMQNPRLGLKEKVLTLDVAFRLKKLLEAAGYQVVLTRKDDRAFSTEKKIDLPMRAQVANRAHADLFVSIHFNSLFPDTKISGTEVYVYTPSGQRSTSSWGTGEADDTRTDAAPVNRFNAWSSLLADRMHRAVLIRLKTVDRGQKTKHLLALQDLECPAILVESVFLSNDAEARRAATPEFRQQIASALAAGIDDYANLLDSLRPKP